MNTKKLGMLALMIVLVIGVVLISGYVQEPLTPTFEPTVEPDEPTAEPLTPTFEPTVEPTVEPDEPTAEVFYIRDMGFIEAAKIMLGSIEVDTTSDIYGVIDPLPAGVIIESEHTGESVKVTVNNEAYFFIIDDEPYARFAHPVRYVLVEKETDSVYVFNANWLPTIKEISDFWKPIGTTLIKGLHIGILKGDGDDEIGPGVTVKRPVAKVPDPPCCMDYAILIDAGDKKRSWYKGNSADNAAEDADKMQKILKKKKFKIYRYSQFWKYENKNVEQIPVDPEKNSGEKFIKDLLIKIRDHFIKEECCKKKGAKYELFIYINSHSSGPGSSFNLYNADGSGKKELINYHTGILKHLEMLPQCVKITLFVDACFSGSAASTSGINTFLRRGNIEVITAGDENSPVDSGHGAGHRSFTSCFIEAFKKNKKATWEEIFKGAERCWRNYYSSRSEKYPNAKYKITKRRKVISIELDSNIKYDYVICKIKPKKVAICSVDKESKRIIIYCLEKGDFTVTITYWKKTIPHEKVKEEEKKVRCE